MKSNLERLLGGPSTFIKTGFSDLGGQKATQNEPKRPANPAPEANKVFFFFLKLDQHHYFFLKVFDELGSPEAFPERAKSTSNGSQHAS